MLIIDSSILNHREFNPQLILSSSPLICATYNRMEEGDSSNLHRERGAIPSSLAH